jgi:hypothetical protein
MKRGEEAAGFRLKSLVAGMVAAIAFSAIPAGRAAEPGPAAAAAEPSALRFWTVTFTAKTDPKLGTRAWVYPFLVGQLPAGATTRYSWRVEPVLESVFGPRKVAGPEIMEEWQGEIKNRSWRQGVNVAGVRRWFEEMLATGRDPSSGTCANLHVPADRLRDADMSYRVVTRFEVTPPIGQPFELTYSEVFRFPAGSGNEIALPADMRDPAGVLPDDQAREILRGWLKIDDWYVQSVAIIRLKRMGYRFKPDELLPFFRLAALSQENDHRMIMQAMDLLSPEEAADGVDRLLRMECDWAVPYAIRNNVPRAQEYLRNRTAALFLNAGSSYGDFQWNRARILLGYYVAVAGAKGMPFLVDVAHGCQNTEGLTLILKSVNEVAPDKALALARWSVAQKRGVERDAIPLLLAGGKEQDCLLALRRMGEPWGDRQYTPSREDLRATMFARGPAALPESAVPLLLEYVNHGSQTLRDVALMLLTRFRSPAATAACVAALTNDDLAPDVASSLFLNKRDDVAPVAAGIALARDKQGKRVGALLPLALMSKDPSLHDIAAFEYMQDTYHEYGDQLHAYLLLFPEPSAAAARTWLDSDVVERHRLAVELLFELGDGRGVQSLLNRAAKKPVEVAKKPEDATADSSEEDKPKPWDLGIDEMNYLAAFIGPQDLAAHARVFTDCSPRGYDFYFDGPGNWDKEDQEIIVSRTRPLTSAPTLAGIRGYMEAVAAARHSHPVPMSGGPGPLPVPSPIRILHLRKLTVQDLLPLTRSDDPKVRALGADLLGAWPPLLYGQSSDEVRSLRVEAMLYDTDPQVALAAFASLVSLNRATPWACQLMLASPLEEARARGIDKCSADQHMQVLGFLAKGHSLGLKALDWHVTGEKDIVSDALASPAMTPILAREIVEKLAQRPNATGFQIVRQAWPRQLDPQTREAVLRSLATMRTNPDYYHPIPIAADTDLWNMVRQGLTSKDDRLRSAALAVLRERTIPASIPLLTEMLGTLPEYDADEAIVRQGPDDRLLAALEKQAAAGRHIMAFVSLAPRERLLPVLRRVREDLQAAAKTDSVASNNYESLMSALVALGDEETLPQQAVWRLDPNRYSYRAQPVPQPALRAQIARLLLAEKKDGKSPIDTIEMLCEYDPSTGIPKLISSEPERLGYVLGYGFEGATRELGGYVGNRDNAERVRQARRWWNLEQGRDLETLKAEALFP